MGGLKISNIDRIPNYCYPGVLPGANDTDQFRVSGVPELRVQKGRQAWTQRIIKKSVSLGLWSTPRL